MIDASVVLAWQFRDETNAYADSVVARMRDEESAAPPVWPMEVANGFLVGVRRKRMTEAEAAEALGIVLELPVVVSAPPPMNWVPRVLGVASTLGLSVYDASYVDLATQRGFPLATLDVRLRTAAAAVGVPIL